MIGTDYEALTDLQRQQAADHLEREWYTHPVSEQQQRRKQTYYLIVTPSTAPKEVYP